MVQEWLAHLVREKGKKYSVRSKNTLHISYCFLIFSVKFLHIEPARHFHICFNSVLLLTSYIRNESEKLLFLFIVYEELQSLW